MKKLKIGKLYKFKEETILNLLGQEVPGENGVVMQVYIDEIKAQPGQYFIPLKELTRNSKHFCRAFLLFGKHRYLAILNDSTHEECRI